MRYLRIRFVRVQGQHPNKSDKADGFHRLYCRGLDDNELSGTIPDVAVLTNLLRLCAAMPLNMACTCVA
eukprot:1503644-Pleurochrysis_carterae.AAC.1